LFAILFALAEPNLWVDPQSIGGYFADVWKVIPVYLIVSFPVLLLYGSLTSLISDYIVANLARKQALNRPLTKKVFLAGLHLLFGCILSYIGILAALLYFLFDLWLSRRPEPYRAIHALIGFCFPLGLFLVTVVSLWIAER
jgi:hypothetical protein